jgi:hypothetical protein
VGECCLQIAGFHQSECQITVRIHERRIDLQSGLEFDHRLLQPSGIQKRGPSVSCVSGLVPSI